MLMSDPIVDFTNVLSAKLTIETCDFLGQVVNGELWFFTDAPLWNGFNLQNPESVVEQALLQFFAQYGCCASMLRLGRSLMQSYCSHADVKSDYLGLKYLLAGAEMLNGALFSRDIPHSLRQYAGGVEFLMMAKLILAEVRKNDITVCPELIDFLHKKTSHVKH